MVPRRPKVSVVVCTYNRARWLPYSLGSLVGQRYPSFEVVVVDDGSTDDTPKVVESFKEKLPLRYVRQEHRGLNAARNRGIREATGELIAFFDDDQEAPPEWLEQLVQGWQCHPQAGVVGGPVEVRFLDREPYVCPRCRHWRERFLGEVCGWEGPEAVGGGNMLIDRKLFDKVGPFWEALSGHGDETEWLMRVAEKKIPIVCWSKAKVFHLRDRAYVWNRERYLRYGQTSVLARSTYGGTPKFREAFRELYWGLKMGLHHLLTGCFAGYADLFYRLGKAWGILNLLFQSSSRPTTARNS